MLPWLNFAFEASQMAMEANEVVALRLEKFGRGGADAGIEAQKMIAEKSLVVGEALMAASLAIARAADPAQVAKAFLKPYRTRVRANRRRLSR